MQTVVVKFGGSSLASAGQFRKVAAIVRENPDRKFVVASAPGKRSSDDTKVTDMLYNCYELAAAGHDYHEAMEAIGKRYADIIQELHIDFNLNEELSVIYAHLATEPQRDYMASRGEYLNSKILAAYLGMPFLDAADYISFSVKGQFEPERTYIQLGRAMKKIGTAVIPGFYGSMPDGTIKTFSRGGSDVTGSIAARSIMADVYENWTDVSGMLAADPRVVENPRAIDYITYKELRELSYMGASVLHEDAVFPVQKAGIPINVRNTNRPQDEGTWILASVPEEKDTQTVTGVAGKAGFSSILIEKAMMNNEVGFGYRLLKILAEHGLGFEYMPSGVDTMSVVLSTEALAPRRQEILAEIQRELDPDALNVEDGLSMIAVVGRGMVRMKGTAARVIHAVSGADINIRMIDQGSDELNIIVGVSAADSNKAINSIYHGVFEG